MVGIYGYSGFSSVAIQVYAYKTVGSTTVYSATGAQSASVTSNDWYIVNWTWDAVSGAEGYRLLRDTGFGYLEYVDVVGATTYSDDAISGWAFGSTVTPTVGQTGTSIQWNPTIGNPNNIAGEWGVFDSIDFTSDDLTDNGPFDIYIDNLANGSYGVFQDFEGAASGTVGYQFNQPSYSGQTSGNIHSAPNQAPVSNLAADTGTKSLRVRWQFVDGATNRWVRFNTYAASASGVWNPLVNLNEPISFRILILPPGSAPVPPPAPTLTINRMGSIIVLSWTGTYRLQAASEVTGVYTDVAGAISPYITSPTEPQKFFRLVD